MSIKVVDGFNFDNIKNELFKLGKEGRCLISIVDFIFSDCIQDLMDDLNSNFSSNYGNKAYPREMLLGIILYCFHLHKHNLSDFAFECKVNGVLKVFTCGKSPSHSTLKRFLTDSDELILKKVFLYTLVQLNELDFLKFLKAFIDGTDGLVNGSKYYSLSRDELKALKLMKKWELKHDNSQSSKNRVKNELLKKQKEYCENEEIKDLIKIILNRLDFYNKKTFKKIKQFKKAFKETDKDIISITFDSAVMMPTKKGNYDFGFNIQEIMSENKIVITGLLLNHPNDNHAIDKVLIELKENFIILRELIEKYGSRRNYKEIEKMLEKAILVFDSGYFSDTNLESLEKHEINGLIMPKIIAKQNNNKIRKENNLPTKGKPKNNKKFSKKDFTRIKNGYICKNNQKLKLTEIKPIQSRKNKEKGINDSNLKEQSYIHKCTACPTCQYKDKCLENSEIKTITDRITPLKYKMINKFTEQRTLNTYGERFSASEGINGYLKNTHGILHLLGSNKNAVKNEIHLKNTMYNLTRLKSLKDTAY